MGFPRARGIPWDPWKHNWAGNRKVFFKKNVIKLKRFVTEWWHHLACRARTNRISAIIYLVFMSHEDSESPVVAQDIAEWRDWVRREKAFFNPKRPAFCVNTESYLKMSENTGPFSSILSAVAENNDCLRFQWGSSPSPCLLVSYLSSDRPWSFFVSAFRQYQMYCIPGETTKYMFHPGTKCAWMEQMFQ